MAEVGKRVWRPGICRLRLTICHDERVWSVVTRVLTLRTE